MPLFDGHCRPHSAPTDWADVETQGNLSIMGDLSVNGIYFSMPKGSVIAFCGEKDDIPSAWVICDGNDGKKIKWTQSDPDGPKNEIIVL